ncbi:MAG: HesA/MoeB/ThiF family protein [Deltaproteobacteria bacterium]|nr:HesA/MoeB/ThiF family protein [Deltaproteobacteria bacterium]
MIQIDKRYARQVMLPEIGESGQARLKSSNVMVIGAGGLGSPLLMYLAAAGVGHIAIVDFDVVDESNLNRQFLHTTHNIGQLKVASAKEAIQLLNPTIEVECHTAQLNQGNARELIGQRDLVLDAVDSFGAKFVINDTCVALAQPFIHAGVTGMSGQLYLYRPGNACLRCVFPPLPKDIEGPLGLGIVGAAAGVIGAQQALLAVRFLLGIVAENQNELLSFDGATLRQRAVSMVKSDKCPACGKFSL